MRSYYSSFSSSLLTAIIFYFYLIDLDVGHTIYESKIEHAQLLNDPQVVKIIEELHKIVGDQEINVIGKHISFDAKL